METSKLVLMRMALGPLGTNCYVIGDKVVGEALIIDPATAEVLEALKKHDLQPKAILLTHGHGDHIGGVQDIVNQYDVPIYIHRNDVPYLSDPELNLSAYSNPTQITVTGTIKEVVSGDHIICGAIDLTVYETPGHTPGGVCYYTPGLVFAGDTLFNQSIGRTDFINGDYDTLLESIKKQLYTLPDETMVYPGHGPETQIGYEKEYNPFVGR
ncbi:MBL fold metallo-hydrolase [Veillonella caviae]|uniref:MBL fold metallo-hydrolase n=1 Tax=Veillonella caviae TaxID=248316 RepID=UPI0023534F7A|nr:MBL fold metallo-hydrolase [Veillonella caviae]MCI5709133.1 MBL fold metallo-hydrolase [Veillonella caviae]MDY5715039.1 MBL fold metallo-hydrolase [Veillonella caviae]